MAILHVPAPDITIIAINTTAVNISWSYSDGVSVKLFQILVKSSGEVLLNNTLPATARSMIYQGKCECTVSITHIGYTSYKSFYSVVHNK